MIIGSNTADKAFFDFKQIRSQYKWKDVEKDFAFFTPALLYWGVLGVDRDIVADYVSREVPNPAQHPQLFIADRPLFDITNPIVTLSVPGTLGVKLDLSRTVYLCPHEVWDGLANILRRSSFINPKTGFYANGCICPDIDFMDYPSLCQGNIPPGTVKLHSFGVYSNLWCNLWRTDPKNCFKKPVAVQASAVDFICKDGLAFWNER